MVIRRNFFIVVTFEWNLKSNQKEWAFLKRIFLINFDRKNIINDAIKIIKKEDID